MLSSRKKYYFFGKRVRDERQFTTFEGRLNSFERTALNFPHSPIELAGVGFFCVGQSYSLRCFKCGVMIENWCEEDIPAVEHEKWSPNCEYVKKYKRVWLKDIVRDYND
jgi:hypothetical protein